MVSRYAHAKQFKRMRRKLKKLRTWLGRVIRDVRRQVPEPDESLEELLRLCERLHAQEQTDRRKLYSLHEPEVMCISKGKAHKRYEFGQKVSVSTTNRGNWIVGVELCAGNPYDGHTLAKASASIEDTPRVSVSDAYVDKGYRATIIPVTPACIFPAAALAISRGRKKSVVNVANVAVRLNRRSGTSRATIA